METNFKPQTIAELGIRLTSPEGSYWNHNGAYQTEGDALYEKLVPARGAAETVHGELIRGINRLTYEYLNNGNCNACEITYACNGGCFDEDGRDPDEIESVQIDEYFNKFIRLIRTTLRKRIDGGEVDRIMNGVTDIIVCPADGGSSHGYFSPENVNMYSRMCDLVIWYVLNTPDTELPASYDRS